MAALAEVEVTVVRVFCDVDGGFGNPLGVVLDGPSVAGDDRQALATHLGYSETVFVDDPAEGRIAIYTPATELPFAGHPCVGSAWLLREEGMRIEALNPPAGRVPVRYGGELTHIAARPEWAPEMELRELADPAAVDAVPVPESGFTYVWARNDEAAGSIRARSFVADEGIPEDEATGAAAVRLCDQLARPLEIRQGQGSVIYATPVEGGMVEIAGRVRRA